jgi:tRNA (guanine-N7-)-methyltransferase
MGQKKLIRFEELKTFDNVLQYPEHVAGKWNEFFKNDHPIVLELACGKGEYTIGLAEMYPRKNFIGIDVKGNRLWVGAKHAIRNSLHNVAFLRIQIQAITDYFSNAEVDEIWITFPDPQLRVSKAKKRLTHPRFLRSYQQILKHDGLIHLKTDSPSLYSFTKKVAAMYNCRILTDNDNVYQGHITPELAIKTHYEKLDIAQSRRVHYLCFQLPEKLPGENIDTILQDQLKEEGADERG